jgi:hypothetical protein
LVDVGEKGLECLLRYAEARFVQTVNENGRRRSLPLRVQPRPHQTAAERISSDWLCFSEIDINCAGGKRDLPRQSGLTDCAGGRYK